MPGVWCSYGAVGDPVEKKAPRLRRPLYPVLASSRGGSE